MLRVAMISGWHVHAKGYAKELCATSGVSITAVYDEEIERGQQWAKELNVPFEADLDILLLRSDVDAVVVTTPTNLHGRIMVAAAQAGKHIFTEKVMALTIEECKQISQAVRKANVKFCISFPHRILPANLFAKKVVDEKWLGEVTLLRIRNAHNGASAGWLPPHFYNAEQCGGGAMMDLGAHSMYLSRWLLGQPKSISSVFNSYTDHAVEDNAVSVIEFANKAIAIAETGFISSHSPFSLELYGTEGSLLVGGPDDQVQLRSNLINGKVAGWIKPSDLPKALPSPIEQWVKGIKEGTEIHFGLEEGLQLTELMVNAYKSHRENGKVYFD